MVPIRPRLISPRRTWRRSHQSLSLGALSVGGRVQRVSKLSTISVGTTPVSAVVTKGSGMTDTTGDIPLDYQYVNWVQLQQHVGRAIMDGGVPLMNEKVAKYLEEQARELRRTAERLETAAKAIRPPK